MRHCSGFPHVFARGVRRVELEPAHTLGPWVCVVLEAGAGHVLCRAVGAERRNLAPRMELELDNGTPVIPRALVLVAGSYT